MDRTQLSADAAQPDSAAQGIGAVMESMLGMAPGLWLKIALSLAMVFGAWLVRRLVLRIMYARLTQARARYQWSKSSSYVAFLVAVVAVGTIWFEGLRSISTFLGLLTAGLAIALRDLVANLAGWLFILSRRPFELGDRIQIGENRGDVVDIRLFKFSVVEIGNWVEADQSTGRIIHIPNQLVFTQPVANYTADFEFLWNEVPVLVTFESDWRKAKEILRRIAAEKVADTAAEAERSLLHATKKFLIHFSRLTPTVYTTVKDSGVLLTIRFLCRPRQRRSSIETVWEAILDAFAAEPDIDLAYPTQRFFSNRLEGKEAIRAPGPADPTRDPVPGAPAAGAGPSDP